MKKLKNIKNLLYKNIKNYKIFSYETLFLIKLI